MTDIEVRKKKMKAFQAKAALHLALAGFTQHWAQMLQAVGEACEQDGRDEQWSDIYLNIDGVAAESVRPTGEFSKGPGDCLEQLSDQHEGVTGYRHIWDDFRPTEEQTTAYNEAMALLDEVLAALDAASAFVKECLPPEEKDQPPAAEPAGADGVDLTAHQVDAGEEGGADLAGGESDGDGTEGAPAAADDPGTGEGADPAP